MGKLWPKHQGGVGRDAVQSDEIRELRRKLTAATDAIADVHRRPPIYLASNCDTLCGRPSNLPMHSCGPQFPVSAHNVATMPAPSARGTRAASRKYLSSTSTTTFSPNSGRFPTAFEFKDLVQLRLCDVVVPSSDTNVVIVKQHD